MIEIIKKHFKKIVIAVLGIFTLTAAAATTLMVPQGGTGANTFTVGHLLTGNGTGAITTTDPAQYVPYTGATTNVDLGANNLNTPKIIGGTTTTSDLTLQTTSGVGTTGADMHFKVGNNGATEAMTILNNGNVGMGTNAPDKKLRINQTADSDGIIIYGFDDKSGVYGSLDINAGGQFRFNTSSTMYFNASAEVKFEGGTLQFNENANGDMIAFRYSTSGENKCFKIYGYPAAAAARDYAYFRIVGANNDLQIQTHNSSGDILLNPYTGNVGIGTTTPAQLLHMEGNGTAAQGWARFGLSSSEYTEIGHKGNNSAINAVGDGDLDFRHDSVTKASLSDAGVLTLEGGILSILETTTPVATANYGKIYTKIDNALYFQDGAGTEHEIDLVNGYAEAYTYNNAVATVIETADTPIALRISTAGLLNNFTFDAGSTGAINSYTDYSGTVAGAVLVTSVAHGLSTDDVISIRGTTNYNGVFEVTMVGMHQFYIIDTWVADDGASDWDQPGHVKYTGADTELFSVVGQISAAPAAACKLIFKLYVNATPQNKSTVEREFAINDFDTTSTSCLISLSNGDISWLSVESDSTNDITIKHGEFNAHRL